MNRYTHALIASLMTAGVATSTAAADPRLATSPAGFGATTGVVPGSTLAPATARVSRALESFALDSVPRLDRQRMAASTGNTDTRAAASGSRGEPAFRDGVARRPMRRKSCERWWACGPFHKERTRVA